MEKTIGKTVARVHEAPTGQWYITDDSLDYLDERGYGYKSERAAISGARELGFSHRIARNGKTVKI